MGEADEVDEVIEAGEVGELGKVGEVGELEEFGEVGVSMAPFNSPSRSVFHKGTRLHFTLFFHISCQFFSCSILMSPLPNIPSNNLLL